MACQGTPKMLTNITMANKYIGQNKRWKLLGGPSAKIYIYIYIPVVARRTGKCLPEAIRKHLTYGIASHSTHTVTAHTATHSNTQYTQHAHHTALSTHSTTRHAPLTLGKFMGDCKAHDHTQHTQHTQDTQHTQYSCYVKSLGKLQKSIPKTLEKVIEITLKVHQNGVWDQPWGTLGSQWGSDTILYDFWTLSGRLWETLFQEFPWKITLEKQAWKRASKKQLFLKKFT
jgi:hypothetical protein